MAEEWKGVTGGGSLGQKAIRILSSFMHVSVGYVLLAIVVPFYMLFARGSYREIYGYFRRHFACTPLKAFCRTYMNHFVFGQCMLDRFAVYAGKRNFFSLKFTGVDEFNRLLDRERGFIIASAHAGNFEFSGYLLRQNKKHIHALAYGGETAEIMNNRTKIFKGNNVTVIPVANDLAHIFTVREALSSGQIVTMSCDRAQGSTRTVTCSFLQGRAAFPSGAFFLSAYFDVPVVSIFVMKESLSEYHVYVKTVTAERLSASASRHEKSEHLTREFVKELEHIVRRYPEQWFNFHKFWLPENSPS